MPGDHRECWWTPQALYIWPPQRGIVLLTITNFSSILHFNRSWRYIHFPHPHRIHTKCLLWLQNNPYRLAQARRPRCCHRVSLYCLRSSIRSPTHSDSKTSRNTPHASWNTSKKKNAATTLHPRQSTRSQSTLINSLRTSTVSANRGRHGAAWPCYRCMSWLS